MKDKKYWIDSLKLTPHPEGGYYSEIYRSEKRYNYNGLIKGMVGERNLMTSIYFLLDGFNFSAFHKIKSDEVWYYHSGDPIMVHVIDKNGNYDCFTLGLDLHKGQKLSAFVKADSWFASECLNKTGFGLVSCAVAPGFDFKDFTLADDKLIELYPQHNELIKRLLH